MAYRPNPSFQHEQYPFMKPDFNIFEFHTSLLSCTRYFLDHAQHTVAVQAVAALINIQLPFQRRVPVFSWQSGAAGGPAMPGRSAMPGMMAVPGMRGPNPWQAQPAQPTAGFHVSLVPYIRRLVVTGFDNDSIVHGMFGDDWEQGVGCLIEVERRNYLFAAKSENWLKVKATYDMEDDQTVLFMAPLKNVKEEEIIAAERCWSEWLAMQDWMLGPRAPNEAAEEVGPRIKRETDS